MLRRSAVLLRLWLLMIWSQHQQLLHAWADSPGSVVDVLDLVCLLASSCDDNYDRTRTGRGQRVRCRRVLWRRGHVDRRYVQLMTASRGTSTDERIRTAAGQSPDDYGRYGKLTAPAPFLMLRINNTAKLQKVRVYKQFLIQWFKNSFLHLIHKYRFNYYSVLVITKQYLYISYSVLVCHRVNYFVFLCSLLFGCC